MKTCKMNREQVASRPSIANVTHGTDLLLKVSRQADILIFSDIYNRISKTLTLLSSEQLAICNPSFVLRHANRLICSTCAYLWYTRERNSEYVLEHATYV